MTPEQARELIHLESRRHRDLILLARHLSLAGRVELELLRAMRLRALPASDPGLEADLYFSSLLQTRGVDSFSFIPAIRAELQQQLGRHRHELELAHAVIEEAHAALDAVILVEERATYHLLRGDREGLLAMQRELGSVVRELRSSSSGTPPDPGLVRWAARVWPRFPERMRRSEAGRALNHLTVQGLAHIGASNAAVKSATSVTDLPIETSTIEIGIELRRAGIALTLPPRSGSLALRLRGSDHVRCELDLPTPGGWRTHSVELTPDQPDFSISSPPAGLIVVRGDNGDEFRLRPQGLFPETRPRLRVLTNPANQSPSPAVAAELEALDWEIARPPQVTRPILYISPSRGVGHEESDKAIEYLRQRLHRAGCDTWMDRDELRPDSHWLPGIRDAIERSQAAIVLVDREGLHRPSQREELTLLFRHHDESREYFILPVALDESPKPPAETADRLALYLQEFRWVPFSDRPKQADAIIAALQAHGIPATAASRAEDVVLIEIDRLSEFESAFQVRPVKGETATSKHPEPEDVHSMQPPADDVPWLVRVGGLIHRVNAPSSHRQIQGPPNLSVDPWQLALESALAAVKTADRLLLEPEAATGMRFRESFRAALLDIEREALDRWLAERQPPPPPSRVPTANPIHAMVFIQYDRWRPKGETAPPPAFDSYRSSQRRLVDLVGDDGTLWVVTRMPGDGPPRYQLAYRLQRTRAVKPGSRDLRAGKEYLVRARSREEVTQFPTRDATDVLLSLQFVTGQPLKSPSEIGPRLRSIPQLTTDDLEKLEAFARQLEPSDAPATEPDTPSSTPTSSRLAPGLYRCSNPEHLELAPVSHPEPSRGEPCLVLLHGLMSNTTNTFSDLWDPSGSGSTWAPLLHSYGPHAYAFEYPSLTQSPILGALNLAKALPARARLHLLSHSTGGLLGELLCRSRTLHQKAPFEGPDFQALAPLSKGSAAAASDVAALHELSDVLHEKQLRVDAFVRVACPIRGLQLASNRMFDYFIELLSMLNLIPALQVVREMAPAIVDPRKYPGLATAKPQSGFIRLLNRSGVTVEGRLAVVAGRTEFRTLFQKLRHLAFTFLQRGDNDLLVATDSMFGGAERTHGTRELRLEGDINHFTYFRNAQCVRQIVEWLREDAAEAPLTDTRTPVPA